MGEQLLTSNQELFEEAGALSDMLEMMEAATETASHSRKAKLQGPQSALVSSCLPPTCLHGREGQQSLCLVPLCICI